MARFIAQVLAAVVVDQVVKYGMEKWLERKNHPSVKRLDLQKSNVL